jgi:hypothetical protein
VPTDSIYAQIGDLVRLSCGYLSWPTTWRKDEENITSSNSANNPCNCITELSYNRIAINRELVINVASDRDYGVYTCTARTYLGEKHVRTAIVRCLSGEFL